MAKHIITLPDQWVTADKFEQTLQPFSTTLLTSKTAIIFRIPPTCKVMVDAASRLLSLANQLVSQGVCVTLEFEGAQHDALSYLNRANFFSMLSKHVHILPVCPDLTYSQRYQGRSRNLVEFESISAIYQEDVEAIPTQLANALEKAVETRRDHKQFSNAAYTIFAELINNFYEHSQTVLDGFAALQVYTQGGKAQVVVSDNGIGLLETLRPKLQKSTIQQLSDAELIRLLFSNNLRWNSKGKGIGLPGCAYHALKYSGQVSIRLATCCVHLKPSQNGYETAHVQYQQDLIFLRGTHICFSFPLDNPP